MGDCTTGRCVLGPQVGSGGVWVTWPTMLGSQEGKVGGGHELGSPGPPYWCSRKRS